MKLFQIIKKPGFFLIILIVLTFFNKSIFAGLIPYPGDLIVANYEPYKSHAYLGFLPGSIPHKAQGPDVAKELVPWKHFVIESLKNGQIPFWNPYNFSGNPQMANFQSGVFYPANLIFFIFNFENAWTLYILSSSVLAAFFTYLFLRRLKASEYASVFGGIIFAFSSYMVVWIEYGNIGHTLVFLPIALYFTDQILAKINHKTFVGLITVLVLSILAGYIQGVFYIYLTVLSYFFIKGYLDKLLSRQKIFVCLAALVFPIALCLFQLLPTFELFSHSTRGNYSIEQIRQLLNPLWYLVTILAPDFFGNPATRNYWFDGTYIERVSYFGLIPFIFAVFAIFSLFKRTEIKIFFIIFLSTILLATDLIITKFFYLIPIPVISTAVPTRILSLFVFSGSILAAFGLDQFTKSKEKKYAFIISLIALLLLCCVFVFVSFYPRIDPTLIQNFNIAKRNLIIPIASVLAFLVLTFFFFRIRIKNKVPIFVVLIFAITFFDLHYYFQKITPFAPREFMYPQTPVVEFLQKNAGINRFWGYGSAYIESNFQTFDKTFSPEGNDPLHIKEYTELVSSSKNGRIPEILPRPDANVAPGAGYEDLANNLFRQKILNIAGVKYVLNKDETINGDHNPDYVTFPEDKYKLVWQKRYWQVYENLKVAPRYFITNKYTVAENSNRALKILFNPEFNERNTLILNEDPKIESVNLDSKIELVKYSGNKVIFKTRSSDRALFYLSDNYYPGWQAYVDDSNTKILRANYTFRAIVVPSGEHKVVFEYKPKSFYYGLYIAGGSLVLLMGSSIYLKKKYE